MSGLTGSSDEAEDMINVRNFMLHCGITESRVHSIRRLPAGNSTSDSLLLISFPTEEQCAEVLRKCRHLDSRGDFERVFVRPDRPPIVQDQFNGARERAKKLNDELRNAGELDRPSRYVVHKRTCKVLFIDNVESSKQKRYVLARPGRPTTSTNSDTSESADTTVTAEISNNININNDANNNNDSDFTDLDDRNVTHRRGTNSGSLGASAASDSISSQ